MTPIDARLHAGEEHEVLAWHFTGLTLRDGRPLPAVGEWLVHDGPIAWCESGLYASRRIVDALGYASGNFISRVACAGIECEDDDKLVCRRRRVIARIDGEQLLRGFARKQALDVAHLWDMPDVVRRYLEAGDESLRAAARAAAWDATRAAARAVAWDVTMDAAWDAWAAARAAAWDEAWDAWAAARAAAWAAARAAAWDEARDAADLMLERMFREASENQS